MMRAARRSAPGPTSVWEAALGSVFRKVRSPLLLRKQRGRVQHRPLTAMDSQFAVRPVSQMLVGPEGWRVHVL